MPAVKAGHGRIPTNPVSAMVRAVLLLIFGGIIKDPPFSRAAAAWRESMGLTDDSWVLATVRRNDALVAGRGEGGGVVAACVCRAGRRQRPSGVGVAKKRRKQNGGKCAGNGC